MSSGIGVCLLAAGNAPIFDRPGVAMRPVDDLSPAELVLGWKRENRSTLLDSRLEPKGVG